MPPAWKPSGRSCARPCGAVLSIYAFSRENWSRGETEVQTLFGLLDAAIRDETPELVAQGVRVRLSGRLD
jgi:undecaprenyl diphosphate synthase